MTSNCKICSHEAKKCFDALILKKYNVNYYKCTNCGFIQTDTPFWLDEAYSNAITNEDIGLLNRNLVITPILSSLIKRYFNPKGKFIDYGGGYGSLTRAMRDTGFDFYRFDTYCENLFAKHFDKKEPNSNPDYELLTSFEVFEHLVDPVEELKKILKWSKNVFFSTELCPNELISPDDWWYVMPETGQHIALYTAKSLQVLADMHNLNYYTNGKNLHLFTPQKIRINSFKLTVNYHVAKLSHLLSLNKSSLLMTDYDSIK